MITFSSLAWLEATALSVWLRESPSLWAFPFVLILHTVGMGFLAGTNVAMDLRVIGFAPQVPLSLFEKFFLVMKVSFVVNAVSGILLLIAYPTKALTNPLFYIKLLLIAVGLIQAAWMRAKVLRNPVTEAEGPATKAKVIAVASLATWTAAVAAGRFLAYTYTYLMAGE